MPIIRLFHGTCAFDLQCFNEASIGLGGDANSTLGVHLTEFPELAAEYASTQGLPQYERVLIVEAKIQQVLVCSSMADFLGEDQFGRVIRTKVEFTALRSRLLNLGYDAIAVDGGGELAGAWVILDTDRLNIIGEMSLNDAYDNDPEEIDLSQVILELPSVDIWDLSPAPAALLAPV